MPAKELSLLRLDRESQKDRCQGVVLIENKTNTYELNVTLETNNTNLFGIHLAVSDEDTYIYFLNLTNYLKR